MNPTFRFLENSSSAAINCVYRTNDMNLSGKIKDLSLKDTPSHLLLSNINQRLNIKQQDTLVIADTLTMTFGNSENCLLAIDAYTNKEKWRSSSLIDKPSVVGRGYIVAETHSSNDRYSLDLKPTYEIGCNQNFIRIILKESERASYYSVADNLIVGLYKANITDIFCLNIKYL